MTPEGQDALPRGKVALMNSATEAYRKWKLTRVTDDPADINGGIETVEDKETVLALEEIEQFAIEGLRMLIGAKNAYEFQDLAAALLRGMGYYTPFVAPRGKDGGVDILAYRDPLGTVSPRIKVQVKHGTAPATVQEIRQLLGLL